MLMKSFTGKVKDWTKDIMFNNIKTGDIDK